jgi:hypothetical protein
VVTAELHAQVSVEDGLGFSVALKEMGKGNYAAGVLGLDNTKKYRLRIKTSDGKIYLSDMVGNTYTPPIDSIGYTVTNGNQVMIYANAHNPNNNTRYYRWDFSETWEFNAFYNSFYMTNGAAIVPRDDAHAFPARCWNSDASTNIILGSTAKLANDVVYQQPITYITGSQKLTVRYSILLKQYGLSQDAFTFWSQIQKNTEQLGSIFDAQPSQINGNIHCTTNAVEPVFGYVTITNVQTKRVYINRTSLPTYFPSPVNPCSEDSVFYNPPLGKPSVAGVLIPFGATEIPLEPFFLGSLVPVGYMSSVPACVDFSVSGSKVPPSFWK